MRLPGAPRVSRDGKRIVYTVDDVVMTADKSEVVMQIWLATTDGKENYQLTFGEESSFNLKWAPDGNSIAFVSNRKNDRDNLYLLRLSNNETKQLTDLKMGIRNFDFSPDGRWIAFTMTAPRLEICTHWRRLCRRWFLRILRFSVLLKEHDFCSSQRFPCGSLC